MKSEIKRKWYVIYYEDSENYCEIYDYIESLQEKEQVKVLNWIGELKKEGPNLPRPYADTLKDGIHELRIQLSGNKIRIFYFFCYRDFIVLTHQFIKNEKKVPEKEIKKAKKIREDFCERYNEQKLRVEYNKK